MSFNSLTCVFFLFCIFTYFSTFILVVCFPISLLCLSLCCLILNVIILFILNLPFFSSSYCGNALFMVDAWILRPFLLIKMTSLRFLTLKAQTYIDSLAGYIPRICIWVIPPFSNQTPDPGSSFLSVVRIKF